MKRHFKLISFDGDRMTGVFVLRAPGATLCAEIYPLNEPALFRQLAHRLPAIPDPETGAYLINHRAPSPLADREALVMLASYGIFPRAIFRSV